jgi:hypothetical protein
MMLPYFEPYFHTQHFRNFPEGFQGGVPFADFYRFEGAQGHACHRGQVWLSQAEKASAFSDDFSYGSLGHYVTLFGPI